MKQIDCDDDLKQAKTLTKRKFLAILNKYLYMPYEELENLKWAKMPAIEVIVVTIIGKAIYEGDDKRFAFLVERLIGPMLSKDPLTRRQDLSPMVDHITQKPLNVIQDEVESMLDQLQVIRGEYSEPDVFKKEK